MKAIDSGQQLDDSNDDEEPFWQRRLTNARTAYSRRGWQKCLSVVTGMFAYHLVNNDEPEALRVPPFVALTSTSHSQNKTVHVFSSKWCSLSRQKWKHSVLKLEGDLEKVMDWHELQHRDQRRCFDRVTRYTRRVLLDALMIIQEKLYTVFEAGARPHPEA